jgi:hypothetical protein
VRDNVEEVGLCTIKDGQPFVCFGKLDVPLFQLAHESIAVCLKHFDFLPRFGSRHCVLHCDCFVQCDKNLSERCRFFQEFVRAKAEGQLLIARRVVCGSVNDNWHGAQAVVRADFVAQPVAVHTWHQDVRQHGLHLFASKDLQGFDAIGGFERGVARGLEPLAQELSIGGDIVYDNEFNKNS